MKSCDLNIGQDENKILGQSISIGYKDVTWTGIHSIRF